MSVGIHIRTFILLLLTGNQVPATITLAQMQMDGTIQFPPAEDVGTVVM